MQLKGKRALVTGGLTGIGAAIAERFVMEGAQVTAVSRRADVDDVVARPAATLVQDHADIREPDSIQAAINRAVQRWGGLDIVVAAGVMNDAKVEALDPAKLAAMLDTNVVGTHNTVRAAAAALPQPRGGHILTLSSTLTRTATVGTAGFAGTKAWIEAYTKTAAAELARRGILMNCLAPGFTNTGLSRALTSTETWPTFRKRIALARTGHPDEIAKAAVWLVSPDNTYMIGETVHVNGGLLLLP
jgi:3-oxoacyl-[acyl-carrier protein] reductase